MTIARYKCDRCGVEFNYSPHPVIKPENNIYYFIFEDYDLCNKCAAEARRLYNDFEKKIKIWMKNKKEDNNEG